MGLKLHYVSEQSRLYEDNNLVMDTFDNLLAWIRSKQVYCVDTETTGLDPHCNQVLLLQIGTVDEQWLVDGTHPRIPELKPYLESTSEQKMGVNLAFDYKMLLSNYGIRMEKLYDVARVDEVLFNGLFENLHSNPQKAKGMYMKTFSLAGLCRRHLGLDISKTERKAFHLYKHCSEFPNELLKYAARDVIYPELIRDKQVPLITKYDLKACIELENAVIPAIADMEYNGIKLDIKPWMEMARQNETTAEAIELELDSILLNDLKRSEYKLTGIQGDLFEGVSTKRTSKVNWRSPVELQEVLKKIGLDLKGTTKRELQSLGSNVQLVTRVLKGRELFKAVDSYGFAFLEHVNAVTNRIHPNFNQLFPTTGRLSCEDPNLQNVKRGSIYRSCFIAEQGNQILTGDFSGQELRIMAAGSGDETWIETFKRNEDLHGKLAASTFSIPISSVKKQAPGFPDGTVYRDVQKNIDFLIPYGGGADKISELYKLPLELAEKLVNNFFDACPKVKKFLYSSGEFGMKYGYSRTLAPIGRIRWYPEHSKAMQSDKFEREKILSDIRRQAMNLPVQGTGADLVKMAMVDTREFIRKNNLWSKIKMVLQVHDELNDEVVEGYGEHWKAIKRDIMIKAGEKITKVVPMEVGMSLGSCWSK